MPGRKIDRRHVTDRPNGWRVADGSWPGGRRLSPNPTAYSKRGPTLSWDELVVTKRRRKTVYFDVNSKSTKGRTPFRIGS